MLEVVEYIVKQLVDDKDSVLITSQQKDGVNVITVKVAQGEVGKIIGKKGKIVTAIRTVVKAAGIKQNEHYLVEIAD